MTTTVMEKRSLTASSKERMSMILDSANISTQGSIPIHFPSPPTGRYDTASPRTPWKTKDDIRYYFRPVPKEDIRVYFRPVSKALIDRPRPSKDRVILDANKVKGWTRKASPTSTSPSLPGPEVPPKAKGRTAGQKNRDIFLAKQQVKRTGVAGQTNQHGSAALPGFDPVWANDRSTPSSDPLSPRITEVVDSSLLPPPLRNKTETAAKSSLDYADATDKQTYQPALEVQPPQDYQQSIKHEYQQTTLAVKPNSIYGTLPPLPIRIQRNNSNPTPVSPAAVRHRRQDTPYSPNDVGKKSAFNSPATPVQPPAATEQVRHTSPYASSDALPTPVALEEWASEQRRIAHGQPAAAQPNKGTLEVDKAKAELDKTLKKTKSLETKFFRSRKGKAEKKEKVEPRKSSKGMDADPPTLHATSRTQTAGVMLQDLHHPGTRWDTDNLLSPPDLARPGITTTNSDMNNNPRSAPSINEKIVVDPQLSRAHSAQSSIVRPTVAPAPRKKPNKVLRWMEAYSKNLEGLQMVQ